MVLSRSQDGFTASTPLEALTDERNAILAIGMNGEPLPPEHGFPVRMVVPGLYGYVSATKWVVELKVTRFDRDRAYWTDNGWSEKGPIKIACRIDRPLRATAWPPGRSWSPASPGTSRWASRRWRCRSTAARGSEAELATAISDGHLGAVALDLGGREGPRTASGPAPPERTARCRPAGVRASCPTARPAGTRSLRRRLLSPRQADDED